MNAIQYVSDNSGVPTGVIVPMELWGEIKSERKLETTVDALAEIAKLAQPLGPADLARHFEHYAGKRIADEPTK
ncbi:hypothetical protein PN36_29760 [Candidatus Thiomargarita nelsonii]|uniref:Uncharacterized protein n=1 Tax=Candidatus Thiomargarita nelsonii TaxID=1003181 RepID=A0A0A6PAU3_9GAMM|nr:hypothetical protein PN36_29760 [Candidatus Thiomargarita nelsonii]